MERAASVVLIFAAALIIMSGCLSMLNGSSQYTSEYVGNLSRVAISNPANITNCSIGSCWCMACRNGSTFFVFLTSMVGGSCYFETDCNPTTANALINGSYAPDISIRNFMIGSGPSLADWADSNGYCVNNLRMAVQWLVGSNTSAYDLPSSSRAVCMLDKGVMPVYVLYSGGKNINVSRTAAIARLMGEGGKSVTAGRLSSGPVGPVVITTEMNYNASQANDVIEQVRQINSACGNVRDPDPRKSNVSCLVAVAPKMNDKAALDAVMKQVRDQVDLVAFGVDSHLATGCKPSTVMMQAYDFASYALYNWSKPSIIPYILFDSGGSDAAGTCNWTESDVVAGYGSFFQGGRVMSLQQRGVIGIAPYSFNSSTYGINNPLQCRDCAIGKNAGRMRAWFGGCQAYMNVTRIMPSGTKSSHPSPGTPIIFPNESAGFCDFNANLDYVFRGLTYGTGTTDKSIFNPQPPPLAQQTDVTPLFRCDACLSNKVGSPPFKFGSGSADLQTMCPASPEIDYWADKRSLDPMFVRAILSKESSLNPCAAAKVCSGAYKYNGGTGCFSTASGDDECYAKGLNKIEDPSGQCSFVNANNADGSNPDWRWCALGMMQTLAPPYTFWPGTYRADGKDQPYADVFKSAIARGRSTDLGYAMACNPDFNPFNASDSLCIGTAKLADMLLDAQSDVRSYHQNKLLNWGPDDADKDSVFAYYIAANKYRGIWDPTGSCGEKRGNCWVRDFANSWIWNATSCQPDSEGNLPAECSDAGVPNMGLCYGYTDFVEYVRDCELPSGPIVKDSGAEYMAAYYYLRDNCPNASCPDWRKLDKAAAWSTLNTGGTHPLPVSGTPYIPNPPPGTK